MYCLKTGGLIWVKLQECVWDCDLHVVGDCVTAVLAGGPQFNFSKTDPRIMLIIEPRADPLFRRGDPYGFLIVEQKFCTVTPALKVHIQEWYASRIPEMRFRDL